MNLWVWNASNTQTADSSGAHVIFQGPSMVLSLQLGWYGRAETASLTCALLQHWWLKGCTQLSHPPSSTYFRGLHRTSLEDSQASSMAARCSRRARLTNQHTILPPGAFPILQNLHGSAYFHTVGCELWCRRAWCQKKDGNHCSRIFSTQETLQCPRKPFHEGLFGPAAGNADRRQPVAVTTLRDSLAIKTSSLIAMGVKVIVSDNNRGTNTMLSLQKLGGHTMLMNAMKETWPTESYGDGQ